VEFANAQRRGEYQRAGELAYGRIPELEKRLKSIEESEGKSAMVEEAVTPDHIAQVVSRWTGVPVDKMLEGEKEKLLRMEDSLAKRVVGQEEAVKAVATAVRRARARSGGRGALRRAPARWGGRGGAGAEIGDAPYRGPGWRRPLP